MLVSPHVQEFTYYHSACKHAKNLSTLLLQDDKEFKVSVREGSSSGTSSTDLKSKLLGERRDSSSDRYAPSCFSSLRVACTHVSAIL